MNTKAHEGGRIEELRVREEDGAARHLDGLEFPKLTLSDSAGATRAISELASRLVVYVYPSTGVPGRDRALDPAPGWDEVPGAPGCTLQSLGYRAVYSKLRAHGFEVAGVSSQPSPEQKEFVERNRIEYPLLSDPDFRLAAALGLPTFLAGGRRFYKRLSLMIVERRIVHVRYPVFPPDSDADESLAWIERYVHDER